MFHHKLLQVSCLLVAIAGCDAKVEQIVQRVGALTDKHETLHYQMLDCEERYANQLATLTDLESIKQARPQMLVEASKYRELGERFLTTEGLTPDKLRGVLERSQERQLDVNRKIKEHMERLIGDRSNPMISLEIPHLEWFSVKIRFVTDADDIAHGRPRSSDVKGLVERMRAERAEGPSGQERAQEAMETTKARIDEAKARMEAMRAKMGQPPGGGVRPGPRPEGP